MDTAKLSKDELKIDEAGASGSMAVASAPTTRWPKWKKWWVRGFVFALVVVIAIDVSPQNVPGMPSLQYFLRPVLRATGLWQGEWTLFAPNPAINNGWVSAEIYGVTSVASENSSLSGPLTWNSPYWNRIGNWEKFYRFRYVNYYNRLPFREQETADDFADFILREVAGPAVTAARLVPLRRAGEPATEANTFLVDRQDSGGIEVRLFHNNLSMIMPEDGSFPPRAEETWMSVSRNLTIRKFQP